MKNTELVEKAKQIAENCHTVYLMGTFGAPLSDALITQKARQYPNYYSAGRQSYLRGITVNRPWAFDCVGLIKGILWGWEGDGNKSFGGAVYRANEVPDISANTMAKRCLERSASLEEILPGEAVYMNGHIGIYVGDGTVVESTLTGKYDGVVITNLKERNWAGHGKLPWVEYETESNSFEPDLPIPSEQTPTPSEEPEQTLPKVGDVIYFNGGTHYTSSTGNTGYNAKPGPAKITRFLPTRKHPYHVIHTDKTSNVYGWVDADTIRK